MNKYIKYFIVSLLALSLFGLVYFVFIKQNDNDASRFSKEYTKVSKDNVFVYRDAEEIIKILKNGTGIVYLGFSECPWCQSYAKILNDVAKEEGIDKIYYLDIKKDRENNTKNYQEIMKLLDKNLLFDEEGNKKIYVPDITFVLNGDIVLHDNETSVVDSDITPEQYWTEGKLNNLKNKLREGIKLISDDMCTSCND